MIDPFELWRLAKAAMTDAAKATLAGAPQKASSALEQLHSAESAADEEKPASEADGLA